MRNLDEFTPREAEIFERIKQGEFVEEIAAALKISHSTVRSHYTRIHEKLQLDAGTGILQGIARKEHQKLKAAADGEPGALDTATVDKARERF